MIKKKIVGIFSKCLESKEGQIAFLEDKLIMNIYSFLISKMEEKNISQRFIAAQMNMEHRTLSKLLEGGKQWTILELVKIFNILNCHFDLTFFDGNGLDKYTD